MSEQINSGTKVRINGEDALFYQTNESIMFEKEGRIEGIVKDSIQLVRPSGNSILLAYVAGAEIKSVKIEPIDAVEALILLGKTPAEDLDKLFEAKFEEYRRYLESIYAKVLIGDLSDYDPKMVADVGAKWNELLKIMNVRFHLNPDDIPDVWEIRNLPLEYQVGWAKCMYIDFIYGILQVLTNRTTGWWDAKDAKGNLLPVPYMDDYNMWPEDWERFFLHFQVITKPFLTDKVKEKLRQNARVRLNRNPNQVPKDYNSWFLRDSPR